MADGGKPGSGKKVLSEGKTWKGVGDSGRPLREILYLDLGRITSYLSQLQEGLTEHLDQMRLDSKNESNPGLKLGVGLGINAELTIGGSGTVDAMLLMERKRQHHLALNILEEILEEQELIGGTAQNKVFLQIEGFPFFIDYQDISKRIADASTLREALESLSPKSKVNESETKHARNARLGAEKATRDRENNMFKNYSASLKAFGDRIDLFFSQEKVTATLERSAMLMTPELIEPLYGSPIRAKTTLIGLNMTKPHKEIPVLPGESIAETAVFIENLYVSKVTKAFNVDANYKKAVPIAIFIDVDSAKV